MANMNKHKYQVLKDHIINVIRQKPLQPGERIDSENQLAARFHISRHTVRQAIGDLEREGWLYRIQGKGTFVDSRPCGGLNELKTIGIITTYLNDYIFPSIIQGIEGVLTKNGYNIVLNCTYNEYDKERLCLKKLKSQKLDGLIVEPTKSALPNPNIKLYDELSHNGVPILFIHGYYKGLNYPYIVEDDAWAGYIATKHLIDLGHRKIAGIFKKDDIQGHHRFAGFQRAHRETGINPLGHDIIWFTTGEMEKGFDHLTPEKFTNIFDKCTGVVCYNEQIAVEFMDIVRKNGLLIPEDISLVSFDDSQLAVASEVKLTTVAHPKEKLGEEAGAAIINMIDEGTGHYNLRMKPELVVRESTKTII